MSLDSREGQEHICKNIDIIYSIIHSIIYSSDIRLCLFTGCRVTAEKIKNILQELMEKINVRLNFV